MCYKFLFKFIGFKRALSLCLGFQVFNMLQVLTQVSRLQVHSKFVIRFPKCGCNNAQISKVFQICAQFFRVLQVHVQGAQVSKVLQVHVSNVLQICVPNSSCFDF
jgi:hypothetical protein